ncbi:hypothetical protein D3C87_78010 [compost metagenome]
MIMCKSMYWIIEYTDGKSISENDINFGEVDKKNIRALYFQNGLNRYGVLNNGFFFINNTEFDFKLKQPQKFIQFKSASILIDDKNTIDSWNLGFEVYISNGFEKYVMCINKDESIYFIAQKIDFKLNKTSNRKIRLQ